MTANRMVGMTLYKLSLSFFAATTCDDGMAAISDSKSNDADEFVQATCFLSISNDVENCVGI